MARNKGKDFENCLMYAAWSTAGLDLTAKGYDKLYAEADSTVKTFSFKCLEKIFSEVGASSLAQKKTLCATFEQLGGSSPEPKTDILFKHGGRTYKCSMKWGNTFQASSAGVEGTEKFLMEVIKASVGTVNSTALGEVIAVLSQLDGLLGGVRKDTAAKMQESLKKIRQKDGLQFRLQQVFGSSKSPEVGDMFFEFKKAVIHESLTGDLVFRGNDNAANYVLTGPKFALKPINDDYIKHVMSKSSVRISAKGRGKTILESGEVIRYQECVIRFDMKD
jgi:hypothetical protein